LNGKIIAENSDRDNIFVIFALSLRQRALKMIDDNELKARVNELMKNLNYYLRNYNRLIAIGFRKSVLDREIQMLETEIKQLSQRI
jgi:hypothetical protein